MTPICRPATKEDVLHIAPTLRIADVNEMRATTSEDTVDTLLRCLQSSKESWVLEHKRKPVALCGVIPWPGLFNTAAPWMTASRNIHPCHTWVLRNSRRIVDILHTHYPILHNVVDARNTRHIRWLKWCGFTLTRLHPAWGREKRPFYEFRRYQER